jgi:hypothetical protein
LYTKSYIAKIYIPKALLLLFFILMCNLIVPSFSASDAWRPCASTFRPAPASGSTCRRRRALLPCSCRALSVRAWADPLRTICRRRVRRSMPTRLSCWPSQRSSNMRCVRSLWPFYNWAILFLRKNAGILRQAEVAVNYSCLFFLSIYNLFMNINYLKKVI